METSAPPSTSEDTARHSLPGLLARYEEAVGAFAATAEAATLLDALLLRDAIEQAVSAGTVDDRRRIDEILTTDKTLLAVPVATFYGIRKSLIAWRRTVTPCADAWWWYLDRALPAMLQRAERVTLVITVAMFPFSLGVAMELARLYAMDSAGGLMILSVAATFLGSLSLGGVLSLSFRDRWTALLEEIGFGPRLRVGVTLLIFVVLTGMLASWFLRPSLSRYLNDRGVAALTAQRPRTQLSLARMDFERAVRFDPANAVAHYNLGRVSEDLFNDDRAMSEYLIAFAAGLDVAGNNAAHLYLARGEYDRAAVVLEQARRLTAKSESDDSELRYAITKNMGWSRLGQGRFAEAQQFLTQAVHLRPERADAHCLLAKTLTAVKDANADAEWQRCLGLRWGDAGDVSREAWIREAKAVLGAPQ